MLRSLPRSLASLLLAGAALSFVGTAAAQSDETQQKPAGGGLILPGTVQTAPGGSAAGTITPGARPVPVPQPQAPAATPAPTTTPAPTAAPARSAGPAPVGSPTEEWQVQPQVFSDGTFRMCVTANRFDNGLELLFMKNAERRVNLLLGVPGARMQAGARFPAKVKIDESLTRERPATIAQAEAIMINLGEDPELIKGIGAGNVLSVEVPGDTARFRLKGTSKAMSDLDTCVAQALAGTLQMPPPPPAMPPQLAQMLVAAGLKDARALPVDRMPPEQRPGDYAWQIGNDVLGSVRTVPVPASAGDIVKVSDTYVEQLKKACRGEVKAEMGPAQPLTNFVIRTGSLECKTAETTTSVGLLLQLVQGPEVKGQDGKAERLQLLTIFSHEAPAASRQVADNATGNLAGVLRELDTQAAAARVGQPSAAAPAPGGGQ